MPSNDSMTASRRRRSSSASTKRFSLGASASLALLLTAAVSLDGVHAALCSETQLSQVSSFAESQKPLIQACLTDLKLPTTSAVSWTSFILEDNLQDASVAKLCVSENCVKALITAMENLPDCCSQSGSATTNLPRLADDILHQCDVRDARLLASELEAEIAKLPDLKVQIKSLAGESTGSLSGSSGSVPTVGGIDVIIDVKKRELMKSGGFTVSSDNNNNSATNAMGATSGASPTLFPTSLLIAAACVASQLLL